MPFRKGCGELLDLRVPLIESMDFRILSSISGDMVHVFSRLRFARLDRHVKSCPKIMVHLRAFVALWGQHIAKHFIWGRKLEEYDGNHVCSHALRSSVVEESF